MEKPTKANASALIAMALESNWDTVQNTDGYMKYIATRPRAERLGSHGLFGDEEVVDLNKAMAELEHYTGNVWTHIISLKREDAERLGYDNARAWRNLLRAHRNDIAAAMNIPPQDFRWYAAFHDEGDHPHCHMMAWSAKPGQAYLSRDGIRQIKSKLTNDIFRNEMLHLYEQKSESRDELVRQARRALQALTRSMSESLCNHPEVESLMQNLSVQLGTVKGKKSYGYLPKSVKKIVDEIVDQMERLPVVEECYEAWWRLQNQVDDFYFERERLRPPLSQQKEFRQIKNAVIQEAERIRLGKITFEDSDLPRRDESEEAPDASYTCWELRQIVGDESLPLEDRDNAVAELERLADGGDPHAQHLMGKLYRDGPLLTPDWVNAQYYFLRAAQQGSAPAQYVLGKLYLSDDEEVRDPDEGLRWLKQAAQGGKHYAAYRLGKEYLKGDVVRKDAAKAVEWFTRSAEAGNQYAQYMLGKLYLTGQDVPRDQERGLCWLTQSADQGNQYAQFLLERQNDLHPSAVMLSVTRLLHHMGQIFRQDSAPPTAPAGQRMDSKLRQQIQQKKIAMGHKPNDHEEEQNQSGMKMSGM